MSSEGSDVEIRSKLPKKPMKSAPKSPTSGMFEKNEATKKLSTKDMIHEALTNLKSRKGASLYAIKKYMQEKYNVDTEKNNNIIKKNLKTGVENGIIVQTKGIGATGSFRLAPVKKVETKKKTENTAKSTKVENSEKPTRQKIEKSKKADKEKEKMPKKVRIAKEPKIDITASTSETNVKSKAKKNIKTPKKRTAMMKRKSIGSIIKAPKMKPRGKA